MSFLNSPLVHFYRIVSTTVIQVSSVTLTYPGGHIRVHSLLEEYTIYDY